MKVYIHVSKSFIVLLLMYRSLIHFELFFFIWSEVGVSNLILLCVAASVPVQCTEDCSLSVSGVGTFVENQLTIGVVYVFNSVPSTLCQWPIGLF